MKRFSGSAVPRYQVFTLADGTFVVQWEDKRVQELLTGQYREFDYNSDFGHAITNYELAQLRTSGRVEYFNRHYVWLYALPEAGRFGQRRVLGRGDRVRAYYLITSFDKTQLSNVKSLLNTLELDEEFVARSRDNSVVLLSKNGLPFRTLQDAERAQSLILKHASTIFENLAIAFIETSTKSSIYKPSMEADNTKLNLDEIIASQSDTSQIAGQLVVVALSQDDERQAFGELFSQMKLDVKEASSASAALQLLEDHDVSLFIMDIELPDLHGWQFISKIREVNELRELPIIVITDQLNLGTTVAKVDYLVRPVSIARLRHNVWITITKNRSSSNSSQQLPHD